MKKLLLSLMTVSALFAGDYDINYNEVSYVYNFGNNKCESLKYDMKSYYLGLYRDGNLTVDKKYVNDAGTITTAVGLIKEKELEFVFTNTYGACRLYEDAIIKNMENLVHADYAKLKEPIANAKK